METIMKAFLGPLAERVAVRLKTAAASGTS